MHMEKSTEIQTVLDVVWLNLAEKDEIVKYVSDCNNSGHQITFTPGRLCQ